MFDLLPCVSDLMDVYVAGRDQSAASQPSNLAEGPPFVNKAIISCNFICRFNHDHCNLSFSIFDPNTVCCYLWLRFKGFSEARFHRYICLWRASEQMLGKFLKPI